MDVSVVMGNLVDNPTELKNAKGEVFAYKMVVAVNEGKTKTGDNKASFIPVLFNGRMTDNRISKFVKGAGVSFTGELCQHNYKGKDNQMHRGKLELRSYMAETDVGGSMAMAIIGGNLTADPELRTDASGTKKVLCFDIAYNSFYLDKETGKWEKNDPSFFSIECWDENKIGFIQKYFHKGSSIVVSGQIHSKQYTNKQNQTRTVYRIQAEHVSFGFRKSDEQKGTPAQQKKASVPSSTTAATPTRQTYETPAAYGSYGVEDDEDLEF